MQHMKTSARQISQPKTWCTQGSEHQGFQWTQQRCTRSSSTASPANSHRRHFHWMSNDQHIRHSLYPCSLQEIIGTALPFPSAALCPFSFLSLPLHLSIRCLRAHFLAAPWMQVRNKNACSIWWHWVLVSLLVCTFHKILDAIITNHSNHAIAGIKIWERGPSTSQPTCCKFKLKFQFQVWMCSYPCMDTFSQEENVDWTPTYRGMLKRP